jgi:hypothetical protein
VVERFCSRPDFDRDLVDRSAAAFETLDDGLAQLRLGLGEGKRR